MADSKRSWVWIKLEWVDGENSGVKLALVEACNARVSFLFPIHFHRAELNWVAAKMSWQTYVDEHLLCDLSRGNRLSAAAIVGHDGSVWAQSDAFPQIKPEEVTAILNDFAEPGSLAPTGLYLGGTKYMVIQGEPGAVIRGKKGSAGVTIKKTNCALVFGLYDEPVTPGECNMIVERLGDYLIEQSI